MRRIASSVIMVVDDDPDVRSVLTELLGSEGYRALACGDEREALDILRTVVPDLIILDLRMAQTSGPALLDQLFRDELASLRRIPVLVLSAHLGEEPIDRAGLNIVGELTKPFVLETLLRRVQMALGDDGQPFEP